MKNILLFHFQICYIDHGEVSDDYTKALEEEVSESKNNTEWRRDYMTLSLKIKEERKEARLEGLEEGKTIGLEEGKSIGLEEGKTIGRSEGANAFREEMIERFFEDNLLTDEQIGSYVFLDASEVKKLREEYNKTKLQTAGDNMRNEIKKVNRRGFDFNDLLDL
ncbi:MAG: hypothetical protein IJ619_10535 [Eubacterium sp.]|nr:hypothetical protein [Eubacterium sp.]